MTNSKKQQIADKLREYVDRYDSQNKAANSLKGVSSATVSQVLNQNWELIKAEMWRNIASQIGWSANTWNIVKTRNFQLITNLLKDAQDNSHVYAICEEAGSGKTEAVKNYVADNRVAYLLQCNEYWNRKYFLAELLSVMGRDSSGLTVAEMMHEAVRVLKTQEAPLLILDEADKLSDQVMYFFITLYNQLEDHAGIILIATDHLSKRIKRGLKLNKKGYKEIYSRIGRRFIEFGGITAEDVAQVCLANGITERTQIKEVYKDCENDLRRVKRKIHALKLKQVEA